jgi:hypothetical protein
LFHEGEDDVVGSAEAIINQYMFYIGSILVKMPAAEPEKAAIKPNFRTPPCSWRFIGNKFQYDSM